MEAREDVFEDGEAVCSARMVVLWAMHEYSSGLAADDDDAMFVIVSLVSQAPRTAETTSGEIGRRTKAIVGQVCARVSLT